MLEDVKSKIQILKDKNNGMRLYLEFNSDAWYGTRDSDDNEYWLTVRDFITPDSLYLGNIDDDSLQKLKSLSASLDASN